MSVPIVTAVPRVVWPARTDLARAAESAAASAPLACSVCTEALYEPISCGTCGFTVCMVCFFMMGTAPPCPICRTPPRSWVRNLAARDALLASPCSKAAYFARHDALCANPLGVVGASLRHTIPDASLRWSDGLSVHQALVMFNAAFAALRQHAARAAQDPASVRTVEYAAAPRGVLATRLPTTIAAAHAPPLPASFAYICAAQWGNWVEFQSPTLGYAICARSDAALGRAPSGDEGGGGGAGSKP